MKKLIKTVGDLREALKLSEDEESLIFDFEEDTVYGRKKTCLDCVGVGSSGGGTITVICLDRPK